MMTLTTKTLETSTTELLNNSMNLLNQGDYKSGIQLLTLNLKKLLDAYGSETVNSEIKNICIKHPISKAIFQDPLTFRSFSKPEGYAGDAQLIDYFYGLKPINSETTYLGRQIFNANATSSSTESVRWRAHHLSELINQSHLQKQRKLKILSVASGRCRELSLIDNPADKVERFVCLDQDEGSNALVRKNNPYPFLHVLDESIRFILKEGFGSQEFDFIYSAGLFDYLETKLAARLISKLYKNLASDGLMLIPNFAPGVIEQGYMETFMDWKLIYRTEEEMVELADLAGIPSHEIQLYRDPMYNVIYMKIER